MFAGFPFRASFCRFCSLHSGTCCIWWLWISWLKLANLRFCFECSTFFHRTSNIRHSSKLFLCHFNTSQKIWSILALFLRRWTYFNFWQENLGEFPPFCPLHVHYFPKCPPPLFLTKYEIPIDGCIKNDFSCGLKVFL